MEIINFHDISSERIAEVFQSAFADYAVSFSTSQLHAMWKRRGLAPELSFAAVENGEILSFILNGIGFFNGKLTCYDFGTGTIRLVGYCAMDPSNGDIAQIAVEKSMRHLGIATELLRHASLQSDIYTLKVINVDNKCESLNQFLRSCNFETGLSQYAMKLDL